MSSDQINLLARIEHSRWMADKILQGWRFGEKRNNELKLNPLLVPYENLIQAEKDKDINTIKNIPRLLKLNDKAIFKTELT